MNIFANTIFTAGVASRMQIMFQNCRFSINIFCILVRMCVIEITLLILGFSQALCLSVPTVFFNHMKKMLKKQHRLFILN